MDTNPTNQYAEARALLEEIHHTGFGKYKPGPTGVILRPQQYEALNKIIYATFVTKSKYIVLSAPTGCGKSLIAKVYARIMLKMNKYTSSIMTANRELQKQYGRDLEGDTLTKIVMGTANYRCSLFDDFDEESQKRKQVPVSQAPCQKDGNTFGQFWSYKSPAFERSESQIETMHADQDRAVLALIPGAIWEAEEEAEAYSKAVAVVEGVVMRNTPDGMSMAGVKKACKKQGSCSYYHARTVADLSPITVRSLQHLIFYIMFRVGGNNPILQEREIHIIDEFHTIESVFRDFMSATISELSYKSTIMNADPRDNDEKRASPFPFTFEFSKHKVDTGTQWTENDKAALAMTLEKELGSFIEFFIIPKENELRADDRIYKAREFAVAAIKGELHINLEDDLTAAQQTIVKWFTNVAIANQERHKKKVSYGTTYKTDDKNPEFSVFPVFLDKAKRFFGTEHTLFMSATPIPAKVFEKMFDVEGEVSYIEVPSDFPPERSPIYFSPIEKMTDFTAKNMGALSLGIELEHADFKSQVRCLEAGWDALDKATAEKITAITEHFPNLAGIVPCNSYKRVKGLMKHLGDNPRFVWVTVGTETKAKVGEFRERVANGEFPILVSASISEGHSFDDDISRLQIIPKMPFPSIDPAMKILMSNYGKPYYESKTVATIQQMCGRSMRSKDDYCLTVILDQKFEDVKNNSTYNKICSKHFLDCIRWDGDWMNYQIPQD